MDRKKVVVDELATVKSVQDKIIAKRQNEAKKLGLKGVEFETYVNEAGIRQLT